MKVGLFAIGRLKSGPDNSLCERYAKLFESISRQCHIGPLEIVELNESKASTKTLRCKQEADLLRKKQKRGAATILLDETGVCLTSIDFCQKLFAFRDQGYSEVQFFIGGPDGLDPDFKREADLLISLSSMTLPHGLARLVLLEQLYRAVTIHIGHPYHRE